MVWHHGIGVGLDGGQLVGFGIVSRSARNKTLCCCHIIVLLLSLPHATSHKGLRCVGCLQQSGVPLDTDEVILPDQIGG